MSDDAKFRPIRPLLQAHAPARSNGLVKSAGRVLQIFEVFDNLQRPASVTEISRALSIPQSSTSVLLKSMVELGYLAYGSADRMFRPTSNVALLGTWIDQSLIGNSSLLREARGLAESTGCAVIVATRNQVHAQYAHVAVTEAVASNAFKGMRAPLTTSALGLMLIADLPDAEVRRIALRAGVEAGVKTDLSDLMNRVEDARTHGYAFAKEGPHDRHATLAVALSPTWTGEKLSIGLHAETAYMSTRFVEFVTLLKHMLRMLATDREGAIRTHPPAPALTTDRNGAVRQRRTALHTMHLGSGG